MYNWSTDQAKLKKKHPRKYLIWKLEQLINFGLNGRKLKASQVRKHWTQLRLDPNRRRVLKFWLWPNQS